MEGHNRHNNINLHHHQRQLHHQNPNIEVSCSSSTPQWSLEETKEFLMIRAELDQTFMDTKRNKQLWEVVANRMIDNGFLRTADQCKCKWKNLVTRYKGCETMEGETLRQQFPFYNELQAIFTRRMQRMIWAEAESGSKKRSIQLSSDEEEEETNELESEEKIQKGITKKKKKAKIISGSSRNNSGTLKEILEEFMRQQMQIEAQWMEAYEARENERRIKEMEWRQTMEVLENERIMMDQRWREREEQRRVREEARAEKRDALIIALLNKLERQDA